MSQKINKINFYNRKINFFTIRGVANEKNLAKRKSLQLSKTSSVQKIINNVKSKNIKAVLLYEKKFNKIKKIKISNIKFSKKEITQIVRKLNKKTTRKMPCLILHP